VIARKIIQCNYSNDELLSGMRFESDFVKVEEEWEWGAVDRDDDATSAKTVYLGNGRLALYPSLCDDVIGGMRDAALSYSVENDEAASALAKVFRVGHVRLGRVSLADTLYQKREAATHDMYSSSFEQVHTAIDRRTGRNISTARSTVYPLRQYPFCSMQTIELVVRRHPTVPDMSERVDNNSVDIYYGAAFPSSNIVSGSGTFSSTTVTLDDSARRMRAPSGGGGGGFATPIHCFEGQAISADDGRITSFASCYLWDDNHVTFSGEGVVYPPPEASTAEGGGGQSRGAEAEALFCLRVRWYPRRGGAIGPEPDEGSGDGLNVVKMHALTCHAHGGTKEECRAVLASILEAHCSPQGDDLRTCAASIEAEHLRQWRSLWASDIIVRPVVPPEPEDVEATQVVQRSLREALYHVYASVRAGSDVLFDGPGLEGSFARAYWLTPALLFLHPDLGRDAVERAHARLMSALRIYAKTGAYPAWFDMSVGGQMTIYATDTKHEKTDSPPPPPPDLVIALMVINAWDYYRTTVDDAWLVDTGARIMGDGADYLHMRYAEEGGTDRRLGTVGSPSLPVVRHSLTHGAMLMAFEYAVQASAMLELRGRSAEWKHAYEDLVEGFEIDRGDALSVVEPYDQNITPEIDIVGDVMALFAPPLDHAWKQRVEVSSTDAASGLRVLTDFRRDAEIRVIQDLRLVNQDYYTDSLPPHPYNVAWRAMTAGALMRLDASEAEFAFDHLTDLRDVLHLDGRPSFRFREPASTSVAPDAVDDMLHRSSDATYAHAVYLRAFLVSLCGVRPFGKIGDGGFLYERFKNDVFKNGRSVLPPPIGWISIHLRGASTTTGGIGVNRADSDAFSSTRVVIKNDST